MHREQVSDALNNNNKSKKLKSYTFPLNMLMWWLFPSQSHFPFAIFLSIIPSLRQQWHRHIINSLTFFPPFHHQLNWLAWQRLWWSRGGMNLDEGEGDEGRQRWSVDTGAKKKRKNPFAADGTIPKHMSILHNMEICWVVPSYITSQSTTAHSIHWRWAVIHDMMHKIYHISKYGCSAVDRCLHNI